MKKDNLKYIIPIIVLIGIVILVIFSYYKNESDEIVIEKKNEVKEEAKKEDKIYYMVDIKGAVNKPGVYKLEEGSRVIDVINASEGLTDNADTSNINLSKKIKDEMFIIIYTKEEIEKYKNNLVSTSKINEKLKSEIIMIDDNNDAQIKIDSKEKYEGKININTAGKEELTSLNSIGESRAESIIKYRNENGDFKEIEDIKNVSGIGDSLFEKIKEYITI